MWRGSYKVADYAARAGWRRMQSEPAVGCGSNLIGRLALIAIIALVAGTLPCLADTHIYAGALGTNQNDQLYFSNGLVYDATRTGYGFPQILRTNGLNKGYYRGDVLTLAALAGTEPNGGPIPGHAAFGAWLAVQVVSVAGPPGGSFAFWEGDGESDLGVITFSVPTGTTNGTNYFIISENSGTPDSDPYGHIHAREFTTSLPGTYIVGLRLIDLSTNGTGGGPIHSPSDVLPVRFRAGMWIESFQTFTNRATVSFRSLQGITNALEATDAIESGAWARVAGPLKGSGSLQTLTETNAPVGHRYYRLRVLNNLP